MSKGKWKSTLLAIQGVIGHKTAPDWDFLYQVSTVRNANYNIGDRVVLPDGRVFRYALSTGTLVTSAGAKCWDEETIKYASIAANRAVGDKYITVTIDADDGVTDEGTDAAGVIAEDELRGGYVCVYDASDVVRQHYGIIGNSATTGAGTITIYLDAALAVAALSTGYVEVMGNPYGNVRRVNDGNSSCIGVPLRAATDGQYCWLQTWGPICLSPGSTTPDPGADAEERRVDFDAAGNLVCRLNSDKDRQMAGFIIQRDSSAAAGPPFIMLQISP